jgi:hypothetical protein
VPVAHHVTGDEKYQRELARLWSRGPDETLLELAEEQRLSDPEVLEAQVRRMLALPMHV